MKTSFTLVFLILFCNFIFGKNSLCRNINTPTIVEITDTTLENIYYHQTNFTEPTRLVFTNLTSVSGYVYFHQNINLVEVDFPVLETTDSNFYFNENSSLEIINAPNLTTITNYLYIHGNEVLEQLNICNLSEIKQEDSFTLPYYSISNNNSTIDVDLQCFSSGAPDNLIISNTSIDENQNINSLIGTLSADTNDPSQSLIYYLPDLEFDNDSFLIVENELVTNTSLDFETKNEYVVKIGVRNQLGEKIENEFTISILDVSKENVTTIEITDTTLENIYYHQTNFTEPTRLVFTNLTSVSGYVYFHQNINLVEVDFPVLETTDSNFYFNENSSLEIINAPNLTTITNYLYIHGNEVLEQLNICNLSEIKQEDSFTLPYYSISNNNSTIDVDLQCFSSGAPDNLIISNTSIDENQNINSLIGTLSADTNDPSQSLIYYLPDLEFDNDSFLIVENELVTNTPLDFETKNEYVVKIGVRNLLGEKIENEFTITIGDVSSETITTIEITDTTLENIYYDHNKSFITPTKLVFSNLTTVTGYVYFSHNINLVEVDFSFLETTDGNFYFNENSSLEIINAPNLHTVSDYLYVSENNELQKLNICNLSQILPSEDFVGEPYYYIQNNSKLDFISTCLVKTNVLFNQVEEIEIQPSQNTLVGTFTTDVTNDDLNIRYYFIDKDGVEVDSDEFIIIEDKLYLAKEYEDYIENDFVIDINAIRSATLGRITNSFYENHKISNINTNLNEKIDLTISINIEDASLSAQSYSSESQGIIIYPNPTTNSFKISATLPIDSISIFNLTGKLITTYESVHDSYVVENLPSGLYFVRLTQKGNLTPYIKKLIISE